MNKSQVLCTGCGLCCDGSLFNRARVHKNEPLFSEYLFTMEEGDNRGFNLPCSYLQNKCCSIYDERPYRICESFKCKLIKAFQAEMITFVEAARKISETLALKTKVELQILKAHPDNKGMTIHQKMDEFSTYFSDKMNEMEIRKEFGQILLDYRILKMKLEKTFKKDSANLIY